MALTKVLGHKTLLYSFQTLSITKSTVLRQVSTSYRNDLFASPVILAMPSKKRRKVDPILDKAKQDKRKKRIIKALRKMDKKERMPVPLPEIDVSQTLRKELDMRQRNVVVTEELEDERIDIVKDWARYSSARHMKELKEIDTVILAQKAALEELRLADQELYRQALEPDLSLIPYTAKGPCFTPVIPDYLQDGEHQDVTKRFAVQYADMETFMRDITKQQRRRKSKKTEEEEED